MKHFAYILSSSVEESLSWCNKGLLQTDKYASLTFLQISKHCFDISAIFFYQFSSVKSLKSNIDNTAPFAGLISILFHIFPIFWENNSVFCRCIFAGSLLQVVALSSKHQKSTSQRDEVASQTNKQTRTSPSKQTHPHPHHTLDKKQVIRKQERSFYHPLSDRQGCLLTVC